MNIIKCPDGCLQVASTDGANSRRYEQVAARLERRHCINIGIVAVAYINCSSATHEYEYKEPMNLVQTISYINCNYTIVTIVQQPTNYSIAEALPLVAASPPALSLQRQYWTMMRMMKMMRIVSGVNWMVVARYPNNNLQYTTTTYNNLPPNKISYTCCRATSPKAPRYR